MNEFAKLIRHYRKQSNDPDHNGTLTQARLGELLGNQLGLRAGYSGAAVSDWERGKSLIANADRAVLVALVKLFYDCRGIHTLEESNKFLWAGGYRPLDEAECGKIFPKDKLESFVLPQHKEAGVISNGQIDQFAPEIGFEGEASLLENNHEMDGGELTHGRPIRRRMIRVIIFTLFLASTIIVLRFSLPRLAIYLNNTGFTHYQNGNLTRAYSYFLIASLYPGYSGAHYNLGLVFEDRFDFEAAKREYEIALDGELDVAYNNLARLYILEGSYPQAVSLLQTGLNLVEDEEALYAMQKNMGWALLGLNRLSEAEAWLQEAILLKNDRAAAYCLLAQVLESQGSPEVALYMWENCLRYANGANPDEHNWIGMATQRLDSQGDE